MRQMQKLNPQRKPITARTVSNQSGEIKATSKAEANAISTLPNTKNISQEEKLSVASKKALIEYLGLTADESILIISDSMRREIGLSLFEEAKNITKDAYYAEMLPAEVNGQEPPKIIADMMKSVDVVVCPTTKSLTHTDARRNASDIGVRVATMPGITIDTMSRCLSADAREVVKITDKVKSLLEKGSKIIVKSEKGTEIVLPYKGREVIPSTGILKTIGKSGNLPSGEVYFAPLEWKSEGVIVFDGSVAGIGMLTEPIKITIKEGMAVKFEGGSQAQKLEKMLSDAGEEGLAIAEFGIGTNPKAQVTGLILEDEKAMGTIHIAFGNNKSMGGHLDVAIHIDGLVLQPDVFVDKKQIMKKGKLLI